MSAPKKEPISLVAKHDDWIERAAISASALCLVHCLALPLVLAALPALSNVLALPESIHVWILLFAVPSSLLALFSGRARHGASYPIAIGVVGLSALAIGIMPFAHQIETYVTVTGSLALAGAHIQNWRLRHAAHVHG